jgi:iron complex transport system ATP-binding protein
VLSLGGDEARALGVNVGRLRAVVIASAARPADVDIAMEALEALGITALAQRDATRISGGQRQLALVARALAQQANIIVMDEPTASLDLGNRLLILDRIRKLATDGLAVVLSTHEPEQAFAVADNVAVLGRQQHFQTGSPQAILTSQQLTALYGVDLLTGRQVVGPRVTD